MARLGRAIPRRFNPASVVYVPGELLAIGTARANHFSLQYSQTGAGSPDTATQADIAAGFSLAPYFTPSVDGQRVRLLAQLDAPPTAGASFSRAELREVNADGSDAAWDANADAHTFRVKFTPTHLPSVTPAAVFAQMFDTVATADRISIRTQLVSGTARLRVRINGSTVALDATSPINPGSNDLATGVGNIVGVEWDVKIVLAGGAVAIYVNDMATPVVTRPAGTLAANGAANYFKTGIYNQANTGTGDSGSDWGSSEIRGLAVTHVATVFPTVVADLPAATGAMAGTVADTGLLASTLPPATGATTGGVAVAGAAPAALPSAAGTFVAVSADAGTLPATLPVPAGVAAGDTTDAGAVTVALPVPAATTASAVTAGGVLAAALPAAVGALVTDGNIAGGLETSLPELAGTNTATVRAAAVLTADLPVLAGLFAGSVSETGTSAGQLPTLAGSFTAAVAVTAVLSGSLPTLACQFQSSTPIGGEVAASLPAVVGEAATSVSAAGSMAGSLPVLVAALAATATGPQLGPLHAGPVVDTPGLFTGAVQNLVGVTAGTVSDSPGLPARV